MGVELNFSCKGTQEVVSIPWFTGTILTITITITILHSFVCNIVNIQAPDVKFPIRIGVLFDLSVFQTFSFSVFTIDI